jgi:acyl transferase domain-containing protein
MLNDFGRSFSFDERGSGYGRGEGVVTVLLKRLDNAISAGDRIRSVICNTAVNQDGRTNGITLPSQEAQEKLQRHIYDECGLNPHTIDYVEAHGTGTTVGDLAELNAIRGVFCGGDRVSDLYVGSIKSNIGHLESSSGLAGLIKAVLILEKGAIPPNSDFLQPKKDLPLDEGKIQVFLPLSPLLGMSDLYRYLPNLSRGQMLFGVHRSTASAMEERILMQFLSRLP